MRTRAGDKDVVMELEDAIEDRLAELEAAFSERARHAVELKRAGAAVQEV